MSKAHMGGSETRPYILGITLREDFKPFVNEDNLVVRKRFA
jgi:hypothetical protein